MHEDSFSCTELFRLESAIIAQTDRTCFSVCLDFAWRIENFHDNVCVHRIRSSSAQNRRSDVKFTT